MVPLTPELLAYIEQADLSKTREKLNDILNFDIQRIDFSPQILQDQYSICIGAGNFGQVYQLRKFPDIALKVIQIHPAFLTVQPDRTTPLEAMIREIRKTMMFRGHPHVIQLKAYFYPQSSTLSGGYIGFCTDFAEHGSLQNVINHWRRNEQLPFEITWYLVLRWLHELACALLALHNVNQKHKDIKPANILVFAGIQPYIKLADFGLTREHSHNSLSGEAAGTPGFSATEITKGGTSVLASDIYSFAMTACVLLSKGVHDTQHSELRGRSAERKAKKVHVWMNHSPFKACTGFNELIAFLLTCVSDEPPSRPTARKVFDTIGACIQQLPEAERK